MMDSQQKDLHIVTGATKEDRYVAIRRLVESIPENKRIMGLFHDPMHAVNRVHQYPVDQFNHGGIKQIGSLMRLDADYIIVEPVTTKRDLDYLARCVELWDIAIIASVDISIVSTDEC